MLGPSPCLTLIWSQLKWVGACAQLVCYQITHTSEASDQNAVLELDLHRVVWCVYVVEHSLVQEV